MLSQNASIQAQLCYRAKSLLEWDYEVTCMRGKKSWRSQEMSMHPTFSLVGEYFSTS